MPDFEQRLRSELRGSVEPADPSGAFDRILERKIRHRIVRKVELVSVVAVVMVASLGGALVLSRAFHPGGGRARPGAGSFGRICSESTVAGDFDGDGRGDVAVVVSTAGLQGCSAGSDVYNELSVQSNDGKWSHRELRCDPSCVTLAAPDVNGDGMDEVAVATAQGATSQTVHLFDGRTLQELALADGTPVAFRFGGSTNHPANVTCSGRTMTATDATLSRDARTYTVDRAIYTFGAKRSITVRRTGATVPAGSPRADSLLAGPGLCGATVLTVSGG